MTQDLQRYAAPALMAVVLMTAPAPSFAGNQWMMERNAEELIRLNQEILQSLDELPSDGRIYLQARITEKDGKRVITLDRVEAAPAAPAPAAAPTTASQPATIAEGSPLDSPKEYRTFIQYRPLTEVPDPVKP